MPGNWQGSRSNWHSEFCRCPDCLHGKRVEMVSTPYRSSRRMDSAPPTHQQSRYGNYNTHGQATQPSQKQYGDGRERKGTGYRGDSAFQSQRYPRHDYGRTQGTSTVRALSIGVPPSFEGKRSGIEGWLSAVGKADKRSQPQSRVTFNLPGQQTSQTVRSRNQMHNHSLAQQGSYNSHKSSGFKSGVSNALPPSEQHRSMNSSHRSNHFSGSAAPPKSLAAPSGRAANSGSQDQKRKASKPKKPNWAYVAHKNGSREIVDLDKWRRGQ